MPQYSNTITSPSGLVTTAVLNTVDNTITYTLTAPNGATATTTQSSTLSGSYSQNITRLANQLAAGGYNANRIEIVSGARDTTAAVKQQATEAQTAATATDTPVPDAPAPPPPTNNTADPAIPPVPVAPAVENAAPAQVTAVVEQPAAAPVVENAAPANTENDTAARVAAFNADSGTGTTKKFITDEDGQTTLVAVNGVPVEAAQDKKTVTEFDEAAIAAARQAEYDLIEAKLYADATAYNTNRGLSAALENTQVQATEQDFSNFNNKEDWRVRLSLAKGASYLYNAPDPGILGPLLSTNGVIFPYTPAISVAYAAQYDPASLTHTNYKYYTYNSSSVDQITLSCDFTAQDVFEANYLLAVIHFFRSVTKMFYGQDQDPKPGTPPPLCYITGLGAFQFDNHPIAITNFTYSLPTDVDYIRAGTVTESPKSGATSSRNRRMETANLQPGAVVAAPQFSGAYIVQEPTYVPTKIQLSITAVPIISRNNISNNFSFKDYATGNLLRGSQRPSGGIW
jgi:hypothetical protein